MIQNTKDFKIALGYDVVSYFSGAAKPGNRSITHTHRGATYQFSTEANRTEFINNPERYTPLFGGFCAIAMSEGSTVPIHPEAFLIQHDRLLLFYALKIAGIFVDDTRRQWAKDPEKFFRILIRRSAVRAVSNKR